MSKHQKTISFDRCHSLKAIVPIAVTVATMCLSMHRVEAAQRPISEFVSAQGTYCLGTDSSGNPTCGSYGGTGCFLYLAPFPNFIDWTDPVQGTSASFDYSGTVNAFMGNPFGTVTSGSVNEIPQRDGSVIEIITLHTDNALTWASVGFSGTGQVLFGANEAQVAAGAAPSLGSCNLKVVLQGPFPGAPLPDLIELLNGCGAWSFVSIDFNGSASGSLPSGQPGALHVIQTGLLKTAGIANPNSRVALDAFPAEHINIQATGH